MRKIYLNDNWHFTENFTDEFLSGTADGSIVRLPHNCKDLSYNYCDNTAYEMVCGYRRTFQVPAEWLEKRTVLTFGAAGHSASVYLNGEFLCEHHCGYTAFSVELTGRLHEGENTVAVRLDTRESLNQPPFGFVIDYLTYGGLYREVWLEVRERSFIADTFAYPLQAGDAVAGNWNLCCEVALAGKISLTATAEISAVLFDSSGTEVLCKNWAVKDLETCLRPLPESLVVSHGECASVQFRLPVDKPNLWSVDNPNLYSLKVTLSDKGRELDTFRSTVGFRSAQFCKDGFYLNGKKLKLRGLNRHQSLPYVGYAMPASLQRFDAEVLKNELGVNTVRTSHYPQSHDFIDRCDQLGLLVFTEIPGWQHIGNDSWQQQAVRNVDEMVAQYRNHPSIILWGVRINESADNDLFYRQTNAVAHALDNTRPTSGVRNTEQSSLLEDVYAHNDFSYTGKEASALKPKKNVTSDQEKPYFVSEFNGHMYPTKIFDDEAHCVQHAIRHANVLKAMYASEDIAGCIGWCMFDYNTHKDFGSGDRICYHGVMDMFRNPKPAAAVYASQSDTNAVCEVSSSMLIGEHPGSALGDVYVFTNADSVRLYKDDHFVREFFPDRAQYPNMPHPPILVDDFVGCLLEEEELFDSKIAEEIKACLTDVRKNGVNGISLKTKLKLLSLMLRKGLTMDDGVRLFCKYMGNWGDSSPSFRFEAWKNGSVVADITKAPPCKVFIKVHASHVNLTEGNTYDAALVRITALDENGNRLNYFNEPAVLSATGAIEIIGPEVTALRGGAGGTLVRTVGKNGAGELIVHVPGCEKMVIHFNVALNQ